MRTAVFWVVTRRVVTMSYRCFGTTFRSPSSGFLNRGVGTNKSSRNVGKKLPLPTANNPEGCPSRIKIIFKIHAAFKCLYTRLAWKWPTRVETCCFNKHQNLVVLTAIVDIDITRSHKGLSNLKEADPADLYPHCLYCILCILRLCVVPRTFNSTYDCWLLRRVVLLNDSVVYWYLFYAILQYVSNFVTKLWLSCIIHVL